VAPSSCGYAVGAVAPSSCGYAVGAVAPSSRRVAVADKQNFASAHLCVCKFLCFKDQTMELVSSSCLLVSKTEKIADSEREIFSFK
jgi:hypothetical protein